MGSCSSNTSQEVIPRRGQGREFTPNASPENSIGCGCSLNDIRKCSKVHERNQIKPSSRDSSKQDVRIDISTETVSCKNDDQASFTLTELPGDSCVNLLNVTPAKTFRDAQTSANISPFETGNFSIRGRIFFVDIFSYIFFSQIISLKSCTRRSSVEVHFFLQYLSYRTCF